MAAKSKNLAAVDLLFSGTNEARVIQGVIVGALCLNMVLGITIQSWGSFTVYATSYLRRSNPNIYYAETAWVTATTGGMLGFTSYLGGWSLERYGPRLTSLVGGMVLSAGVLASAFTIQQGFLAFLFTYSVIVGIGCGIVFSAPMQVVMRWFPQNPGLITGAVMCGSSLGPMVAVALQTFLVNPENVQPHSGAVDSENEYFTDDNVLDRVPHSLLVMALIMFAISLIGAYLLVTPPESDEPQRINNQQESQDLPITNYSPSEVIRVREFWLMWCCYFFNMLSVNFVMNNVKVFGQGESQGKLTDHQLTFIVSVAALFNGLGRLAWGHIGDQWSFKLAIIGMSTIQAMFTATLLISAQMGVVTYLLSTCVIYACVGGVSSIWAGTVKLYFGDKHFGRNFGLITTAGGLGWVVGAAGFQLANAYLSNVSISFWSAGFSLVAAACGCLLRDHHDFCNDDRKPLKLNSEEFPPGSYRF